VLNRMSALTRSGCSAANKIAIGPASAAAKTAVSLDPDASSTAPTSSAHSSQVGIATRGTPSDPPVTRRSKRMSRVDDASFVRNSA
jgi:hypothetical protein